MGLLYVGPDVSDPADLVYKQYPTVVKAADMTTGQIDTTINSGLTSYVDKSYVDTQDALNATQSYVDTQDNLRVRLTTKDAVNGVAGLDASGRINPARINAPNTQVYHRGPWVPPAYHASAQTVTTEATLFPCPITDPGYPYKLLIFGTIDTQTTLDNGEYPSILVRAGDAATGEIVAAGRGLARSYTPSGGSDTFDSDTNWGTVGAIPALFISSGVVKNSGTRRFGEWLGNQLISDALQVEWEIGDAGNAGTHAVFFCGNSAWNAYAGLRVTISFGGTDEVQFFTGGTSPTTGRTDRGPIYNANVVLGDKCKVRYDLGSNTFTFYHNDVLAITWVDSTNIVAHGSGNRRVGLMTNYSSSGSGFPGPGFDNFALGDGRLNSAGVAINSLATQTVRTGSTTLYVRMVRSGSAASVTATTYNPLLHVMAVPA